LLEGGKLVDRGDPEKMRQRLMQAESSWELRVK
jgi:hypothetical protein